MFRPYILVIFSLCVVFCHSAEIINSNLVVTNVDRSIDITSQVVKTTSKITLQNNGKNPVGFFLFAVESSVKSKLSYIGSSSSDGRSPLKLNPTKTQGHEDKATWRVNLREELKPGKKITVDVESFVTHGLSPFPSSIAQKEKQLLFYQGNLYFYSPYVVAKQTTTVSCGTKNLESYTKTKPFVLSESNLVYGPYENVAAFSEEDLSVHYENNAPFLTVVQMERVLEVSHWGNVAVEETITLEHQGAKLKGSFSRYDYQRDSSSGLPSVKSFKTILPASAKDVYYRDDIGNISTSHLRILSDSTELDLKPRFPLFGGWKTKYVVGYNIPSYEYLYNSGNDFLLKMRVLDHIYDDMVVEHLTTKVILPEGAQNIRLKTPYPVTRLPDEKHFTYLDTTGRPVIIIQKDNLVESHIQDFELAYTFPRILMLQEPILAVCAFFALFLLGIIYVRLDFSITDFGPGKKDN